MQYRKNENIHLKPLWKAASVLLLQWVMEGKSLKLPHGKSSQAGLLYELGTAAQGYPKFVNLTSASF